MAKDAGKNNKDFSLGDYLYQYQTRLQGVANRLSIELGGIIAKTDEEVLKVLRHNMKNTTRGLSAEFKRLTRIVNAVLEVRRPAYDAAKDLIFSTCDETLASASQEALSEILHEVAAKRRELRKARIGTELTDDQRKEILNHSFISGKTVLETFHHWRESDLEEIANFCRRAYGEDLSISLVGKAMRGEAPEIGFSSNVLAASSVSAIRLARTVVNGVSNNARIETFRANADIVDGVKFVGTLDGKTCPYCAPLDGQIWRGEDIVNAKVPPIHPNCRCTLVPYVELADAEGNPVDVDGERPAANADFDKLAEDAYNAKARAKGWKRRWDDLSPSTRLKYYYEAQKTFEKQTGKPAYNQVPGSTTFIDYFKNQPEAFKRSWLGRKKYELWSNPNLSEAEREKIILQPHITYMAKPSELVGDGAVVNNGGYETVEIALEIRGERLTPQSLATLPTMYPGETYEGFNVIINAVEVEGKDLLKQIADAEPTKDELEVESNFKLARNAWEENLKQGRDFIENAVDALKKEQSRRANEEQFAVAPMTWETIFGSFTADGFAPANPSPIKVETKDIAPDFAQFNPAASPEERDKWGAENLSDVIAEINRRQDGNPFKALESKIDAAKQDALDRVDYSKGTKGEKDALRKKIDEYFAAVRQAAQDYAGDRIALRYDAVPRDPARILLPSGRQIEIEGDDGQKRYKKFVAEESQESLLKAVESLREQRHKFVEKVAANKPDEQLAFAKSYKDAEAKYQENRQAADEYEKLAQKTEAYIKAREERADAKAAQLREKYGLDADEGKWNAPGIGEIDLLQKDAFKARVDDVTTAKEWRAINASFDRQVAKFDEKTKGYELLLDATFDAGTKDEINADLKERKAARALLADVRAQIDARKDELQKLATSEPTLDAYQPEWTTALLGTFTPQNVDALLTKLADKVDSVDEWNALDDDLKETTKEWNAKTGSNAAREDDFWSKDNYDAFQQELAARRQEGLDFYQACKDKLDEFKDVAESADLSFANYEWRIELAPFGNVTAKTTKDDLEKLLFSADGEQLDVIHDKTFASQATNAFDEYEKLRPDKALLFTPALFDKYEKEYEAKEQAIQSELNDAWFAFVDVKDAFAHIDAEKVKNLPQLSYLVDVAGAGPNFGLDETTFKGFLGIIDGLLKGMSTDEILAINIPEADAKAYVKGQEPKLYKYGDNVDSLNESNVFRHKPWFDDATAKFADMRKAFLANLHSLLDVIEQHQKAAEAKKNAVNAPKQNPTTFVSAVKPPERSAKCISGAWFPKDYVELTATMEKVGDAGGSTGATIWKNKDTGEKYILKTSGGKVPSEHVVNECNADAFYRDLGVAVPEFRLYRDGNGNAVKLSKFIDGGVTPIDEWMNAHQGDDAAIAEMREKIRRHFCVDVLAGNWDAIGDWDKNIVVDKDGDPWRIDNGCSFGYRGSGAKKNAATWGEVDANGNVDAFFDDLWTMTGTKDENGYYQGNGRRIGNGSSNGSLMEYFGEYDVLQIANEVASLSQSPDMQQALNNLAGASESDKKIIEKRLEEARQLATRGNGFTDNGYVRDFALDILDASYKYSKDGLREQMSYTADLAPHDPRLGDFGWLRGSWIGFASGSSSPATTKKTQNEKKNDAIYNDILDAVKTINHHFQPGGDQKPNDAKIQKALSHQSALVEIYQGKTAGNKKGAAYYLEWINKIQDALSNQTTLPNFDKGDGAYKVNKKKSKQTQTAASDPFASTPAASYPSFSDYMVDQIGKDGVGFIEACNRSQGKDSYLEEACYTKMVRLRAQGLDLRDFASYDEFRKKVESEGYYLGVPPGGERAWHMEAAYNYFKKDLDLFDRRYAEMAKYNAGLQIVLENLDFEGNDRSSRSLILARSEAEDVVTTKTKGEKSNHNRGVNESHAIVKPVYVFGNRCTIIRVPYSRINGLYMIKDYMYLGDKENEISADTHGLSAYYMGSNFEVADHDDLANAKMEFLKLEKINP